MGKRVFFISGFLLCFLVLLMIDYDNTPEHLPETFYGLKERTLEGGKEVDFSVYRGKVVLAMNSACKCGYAKENFALICRLKEMFPSLEILLFPSRLNWVIDQEYKEKEKIVSVLKDAGVYGKVTVFEPRDANDGYGALGWLRDASRGILGTKSIKWNFTKFLVNKEGKRVKRYSPLGSHAEIEGRIKAFMDG